MFIYHPVAQRLRRSLIPPPPEPEPEPVFEKEKEKPKKIKNTVQKRNKVVKIIEPKEEEEEKPKQKRSIKTVKKKIFDDLNDDDDKNIENVDKLLTKKISTIIISSNGEYTTKGDLTTIGDNESA